MTYEIDSLDLFKHFFIKLYLNRLFGGFLARLSSDNKNTQPSCFFTASCGTKCTADKPITPRSLLDIYLIQMLHIFISPHSIKYNLAPLLIFSSEHLGRFSRDRAKTGLDFTTITLSCTTTSGKNFSVSPPTHSPPKKKETFPSADLSRINTERNKVISRLRLMRETAGGGETDTTLISFLCW